MQDIYQTLVAGALFSAFLANIVLKDSNRSRLIDFFDRIKLYKVADALMCYFCTCFWLNVFVFLAIAIATSEPKWMVAPFIVTPISKFFV